MFDDTRPAELDPGTGGDPWAEFRVVHAQERLRLLRALRDGNVPVMLNAPCGAALATSLWTIDADAQRLNFSTERDAPLLQSIVEGDEAIAVAYLQAVKLQFDLQGFTLVRGTNATALQCALPRQIYRFQRRSAYRVRAAQRHAAVAVLRHPALPEMALTLRVLDLSMGGCALWLPRDVPPLQAGTEIGEVRIELDADTRFTTSAVLHRVSGSGSAAGVRLGCEWRVLPGSAERLLQRWIDRAQQRERLLSVK